MTLRPIPGANGPVPSYVAVPGGDGPWPGVVVIHDALGMSSDVRQQCDWLASEGFLAAAPDLYHRGRRIRCLFAAIRDAMRERGPTFDDIETVRRWLEDDPRSTGRVGVIGFCMGGGFSLLLADRPGWAAASTNYGGIPGNANEKLARACPIVGSYGGQDWSLRGAATQLDELLTKHQIPHDVKEYPDAGHGFMNDHDLEEVPGIFIVLGRLSNTEYDPEATADARERIVAFFREHLGAA